MPPRPGMFGPQSGQQGNAVQNSWRSPMQNMGGGPMGAPSMNHVQKQQHPSSGHLQQPPQQRPPHHAMPQHLVGHINPQQQQQQSMF